MRRVLVTGASGCIGHAIVAKLLEQTDHHLVLAVRDPQRLTPNIASHPRVELVLGDLEALSHNAGLASIDSAILAATSWGPEAPAVNVDHTLAVVEALDRGRCTSLVYLSTASILSRSGAVLREAFTLGTPYIASKARCTEALLARHTSARRTIVYPTLVVGGGRGAPLSHFTRLLGEVARRRSLLQFTTARGSLHLVHADDIASVACHLVDSAPDAAPREIVLGAPPVTVEQAIDSVLRACHLRRRGRIDVGGRLAEWVIRAFRIQLAPWDRFCLGHRQFTYDAARQPSDLGLTNAHPNLDSMFAAALAALDETRAPTQASVVTTRRPSSQYS
jgi:nucleoside-diphosphate-sugar epimerase